MIQDMNDPYYRVMRDSGDPDYWDTTDYWVTRIQNFDYEKFREMKGRDDEIPQETSSD